MNRRLTQWASHLAALAVGWSIYQFSSAAMKSGADSAAASASRTRPDPRQADLSEGRRVLEEMRRFWPSPVKADVLAAARYDPVGFEADMRRQIAEELREVDRLSREVDLTDDPGAALAALHAPSIEAVVFLIAWLRADAAAALAWLARDTSMDSSGNLRRDFAVWVNETDLDTLCKLLPDSPAKWRPYLVSSLAAKVGAANPADLTGLLARLEGLIDRREIIGGAMSEMPPQQRQQALDWIKTTLQGQDAAVALVALAYSTDNSAAARQFLKQVVPGMGTGVLEALRNNPCYGNLMRAGVGPDSPLEERMAAAMANLLPGKTEEERRASARNSIVAEDLGHWLTQQEWDLKAKFGQASAERILGEATAAFPDLDETGRGLLLRKVFATTAGQDPADSWRMLEQADRPDLTANCIRDAIYACDFESKLDFIAATPAAVIRENFDTVESACRNDFLNAARDGGSLWVDWLRRQPAGVARDLMAHYTALVYRQTDHPELVTEFRAMVVDPAVKAWSDGRFNLQPAIKP